MRTVASFIAAGYQVDPKKENTALTQAGKISYDDVEAALLSTDVPQAPKENSAGSYERLMGAFYRGQMTKPGL